MGQTTHSCSLDLLLALTTDCAWCMSALVLLLDTSVLTEAVSLEAAHSTQVFAMVQQSGSYTGKVQGALHHGKTCKPGAAYSIHH